jgi:hypothetical protein
LIFVIWILGFTNIQQSLTRRADGPKREGKSRFLWYLDFLLICTSFFRSAAGGQHPKDNYQPQNPPSHNQQKNIIMGDAQVKPFQEHQQGGGCG